MSSMSYVKVTKVEWHSLEAFVQQADTRFLGVETAVISGRGSSMLVKVSSFYCCYCRKWFLMLVIILVNDKYFHWSTVGSLYVLYSMFSLRICVRETAYSGSLVIEYNPIPLDD